MTRNSDYGGAGFLYICGRFHLPPVRNKAEDGHVHRVVRLVSLLSAAFTLGLLVACSTGAPAPIAGKSRAPISPESSPPPLVILSPTAAFLHCNTADLEMQLVRVGVGLGNVGGLIEVRNKSGHDCALDGYAAIQLLDARHRPAPTKLVQSTSSYAFGVDLVQEMVALPAGTVAINPDRPIPGHAYIPISWDEVQEPCTGASWLQVTPPGGVGYLVISAIEVGGGYGLVAFCSGGEVIVNPTRPAFYH